MIKPDWVSWDEIHELLLAAHKKNIEKGVVMNTTTMTGEEIKNYLGESGRCIVALCGNELVGTTSVKIAIGKSWFDKGKTVAKGTMSAILKHYQGLGLLEEMNELTNQYMKEKSVQIIEADTAEDNVMMRKILAKKGFKEVRFFPAKNQNHFSVYFVKWLEGCPFSDRFIQRKFNLSKVLTKIQYGPGKVERSHFLSRICQCLKKLINV